MYPKSAVQGESVEKMLGCRKLHHIQMNFFMCLPWCEGCVIWTYDSDIK